MTNPIEYRGAVPADEEALSELWWTMQSSHQEYDPNWYADKGEETCVASWRQHFRGLLQDENCIIVVATCIGRPMGMLVARFSHRPPIYVTESVADIHSTVVHPDHRGQGVFRAMLSFLEVKALDAGIRVVKLSVHVRNPNRAAYERTGFVPETVGMIKWIE